MGHLPFNRATRAFGHAHGGAHLQGSRGIIRLWQGQGDGGLAVGIGAGRGKAVHHRVKGLVVAADHIAGEGGKLWSCAEEHFTLNRKIGAGRAKEIFGVNRQTGGVAKANVWLGQCQRKVDAFRQKIFDQKGFCRQRRAVQIGEHLQPPDPARGAACDGHLEHMTACARIGDQGARVFHPIRSFEDRGQRQAFDRRSLRITGKGGRKHRFACAISAPVGGQEHIDRRCGFTTFDPTV